MSNIKIQDVDQRVQYTATNLQTVFTVPFPFLASTDLVVYQNSTKLTMGAGAGQYGVSGAGNPSGGTVTLVTGATTSDIITIFGNQPIDRTSIYSATISNLTGSDLNNDFNREIIMLKQLWTTQNLLQLQYQPYAQVSQDETVTLDRWLPVLGANQGWAKNAGNTAIVVYDLPAGGAAPKVGTYLVQVADAGLPNAQAMGALASGIVVNTTTTGVQLTRSLAGTANQLEWTNPTGIGGNPTIKIVDNPVMPGTGGMGIPQGTTAQRAIPSSGIGLRYNTTLAQIEYYNGSSWIALDDADLSLYLLLAGGTMSGAINMGSNKITDMDDPTDPQDAATKAYVDAGGAPYLSLGGGTMAGTINMNNNTITNLPTPLTSAEPATKGYVDAIVYGVHPPCIYSTTANLAGYVYANGTAGVGATLTAGSNGAFSVDGASPSINTRILVPNQTTQAENGIYTLTQVGDGSNPAILTRATDYDQAADMQPGDNVHVVAGATLAGHQFIMTQTAAITVGTTAITWLDVTNTGLGTMSLQNANAVAITGGTINGTIIGGSTPAAGTFSELTVDNLYFTGDAIQHVGDLNNQIIFGTDTQDFQTGGSSRLDLSDTGMRLGGVNSRVTTVLDEDTMTSNSATALATQQSIKQYVDQYANNSAAPNIIIGGNFTTNPWQRGTTFTGVASANVYTADRFYRSASNDAVCDVLKTADSPTIAQSGVYSTSCWNLDVTTADATIGASQYEALIYRVEGYDISLAGFGQANAQTITLSFWHKHTKTGTYCVGFGNAAGDRSYVAEYTQSVSNTWEKAVITLTADVTGTWLYTNGMGLQIVFMQACGSTFQTTANSWQAGSYYATSNQVNGIDNTANFCKFALIKLEIGSTATPYPIENEADIYTKCQRYYWNSGTATHYPGLAGYNIAGQIIATNMTFPVAMRAAPTVASNGTWAYSNASAITVYGSQTTGFLYAYTVTASNNSYALANGSAYFTADAEL